MTNISELDIAPKVSIETARPSQAIEVYRHLQDWHKSTVPDFPAPEEGPAIQWIVHLIETGQVFLSYLDGPRHTHVPAGVLALNGARAPWAPNSKPILSEAFFYVPGAYYAYHVPRELVQAAQVFAGTRDLVLLLQLIGSKKLGKVGNLFGLPDPVTQVGGVFVFGLPED